MAEEARRRQLLRRTEDLLEAVEQLRLRGALRVPARLAADIGHAGAAIRPAATTSPATVDAAHSHLLRLQGLLLAGHRRARARVVVAPAAPGPAPEPARAARDLPPIALPRRESAADEATWREGVQLAVQRAHDLARYLSAQSVAAAGRGPDSQLAALRQDQAARAWRGLEQLRLEAEQQMRGRVVVDPEPTRPRSGQLQVGDLLVDFDLDRVLQGGRTVPLLPAQRKILGVLLANPGRTVTREALMHVVNGGDPNVEVRSKVVDVHLSNLRRNLGNPGFLATVRAVGYRVTLDQVPSNDPLDEVRQRRRDDRRALLTSSSTTSQPSPTPAPPPRADRPSGR
jgi:DNA-binding winged helix-turn-helix (wHTH) protein